jgi:uncharacterized protein YdhG (YjbR/CyaY superfamily)
MNDAEKVIEWMNKLDSPLRAEIDAVRAIIKEANAKIAERIKWNAPSYYYKKDIVTFAPRFTKSVHLVFHYAGVVNIESPILEGDYPTRRMAYFNNMTEIVAQKAELERVMNILVEMIESE